MNNIDWRVIVFFPCCRPCFLRGMNGSIVYELDRPENAGLKKSQKILEKAKGQVNAIESVFWADMIVVAGAEAILVCGGPKSSINNFRHGHHDHQTYRCNYLLDNGQLYYI